MIEKIVAESADIKNNTWILENVKIFKPDKGILKEFNQENYNIESIYNFEKINSLFKNFDTMSFLDLIIDYKKLLNNG